MSGPAGLTSLRLAQFRSHDQARLSFDGRPVAIFGANGAGKTNLIEAISLLSPGRGLRGAEAADLARRPGAPGWRIAAAIATPFGPHEIETGAEPGSGRSVMIDGKPAPQTALARILPVLWLVPAMDRLWTDSAEGRRRFLDRATMSLLPDHAGAVLDYDKAMRDRNRLLRDMVRDTAWYTALETQMARAGAVIAANRAAAIAALAAAQSAGGADAAELFPAADLALIHPDIPQPETEADLSAAFAESRTRDLAAGRTLIGPHRSDLTALWAAKAMPAAACSTGEQKALLISLILANARALAARGGALPLLLLDEVAAHLDATRRAALHDAICGLGAQSFMTGTGPELFTDLGPRAQYLAVTDASGLSIVTERTMP
jgi:DNA replication and repair protein RecF